MKRNFRNRTIETEDLTIHEDELHLELKGFHGLIIVTEASIQEAMQEEYERELYDTLWEEVRLAAEHYVASHDPADYQLFSDLFKDLHGSRPHWSWEELQAIYGRG